MKYIITDWTGTQKFNNKQFETFEDASDYLLEKFPMIGEDEREEELSEFYIVEINNN